MMNKRQRIRKVTTLIEVSQRDGRWRRRWWETKMWSCRRHVRKECGVRSNHEINRSFQFVTSCQPLKGLKCDANSIRTRLMLSGVISHNFLIVWQFAFQINKRFFLFCQSTREKFKSKCKQSSLAIMHGTLINCEIEQVRFVQLQEL